MPQTTIFVRPPGVPDTAPAAVETRNLSRLYARRPALAGVSLRIEAGATVLLEGSNGAGKTTLLRLLATSLRPSFGAIWIDGIDAVATPERARPRIGYLGHPTGLYDDLTGREYLRFAGTLFGVPAADLDERAATSLERVGMTAAAEARIAAYSAGMRRRLALGRLLLGHPRLVLLDEPLTALDAAAVELLDGLIGQWAASGATVVIASHLADRLVSAMHGLVRLEAGRLAAVSGPGVAVADETAPTPMAAQPAGSRP